MTAVAALPALLAGLCVLVVAGRPNPHVRVSPLPDSTRDQRAVLHRLRALVAVLALVGAWIFLGGVVGALAGVAAAVASWRVLGRAESPAARRRRHELERDLPTAVHLLGACLEAGSAVTGALDAVAAALPGAVADELVLVRQRLVLGTDPATAWRAVGDLPELRPLGRAMTRAHESGASVRDAVRNLAGELRAQSRARTDALARSVEVRAAGPLGVCFLPAFVLLGVVPMVVGVFTSMRLFG